jgi:hypothetical protein
MFGSGSGFQNKHHSGLKDSETGPDNKSDRRRNDDRRDRRRDRGIGAKPGEEITTSLCKSGRWQGFSAAAAVGFDPRSQQRAVALWIKRTSMLPNISSRENE